MKQKRKIGAFIVFSFLSLGIIAQQSSLDLSKTEQQKDFSKYLRTMISLLEDKSIKDMMMGYNLKNLSDSNKHQIANNIMKDTAYFKRLNDYFAFSRLLDYKYGISKFTQNEWSEIVSFGAKNGVFFISALNKQKGQKDSLPKIPDYFPLIPLKTPKDSTHSQNSHQK